MLIGNRVESRIAGEPSRPGLTGRLVHVRQSEYLIRPGERPGQLFLLIDGWAVRYRLLGDGRRQITALFLPGDFCDLAWLRDQPVAHHVLALTPVRAVRIDISEISRLAVSQPAQLAPLWQEALTQARLQTDWLIAVGRLSAQERIARLLMEIADRCGMERTRQGSCPFPLTQVDMADASGLTPVHVNRTLQLLRGNGLIELHNRRLRIIDPAALARLAVLEPPPLDKLLKAQCQRLVRVAPRS